MSRTSPRTACRTKSKRAFSRRPEGTSTFVSDILTSYDYVSVDSEVECQSRNYILSINPGAIRYLQFENSGVPPNLPPRRWFHCGSFQSAGRVSHTRLSTRSGYEASERPQPERGGQTAWCQTAGDIRAHTREIQPFQSGAVNWIPKISLTGKSLYKLAAIAAKSLTSKSPWHLNATIRTWKKPVDAKRESTANGVPPQVNTCVPLSASPFRHAADRVTKSGRKHNRRRAAGHLTENCAPPFARCSSGLRHRR